MSYKKVGLKKGDIAMVHSDLRTFGKIGDVTDKERFIGLILNAFLNVLGKEGTLVVPTYTYSFCRNQVFDVKQGTDGFISRLTFAGQSKMGAVQRLAINEDLELIVQDNLTGLTKLEIVAEGSQVVD